ncbi:hypothetical protein [Nocardia cyriacigeorgica]|uniref:Uncharacterized protein n=2 Tax=Nocardia cyriacigeorgica TaxID=135487 RepID=H6R949_NOCCG|nr:hypothetical protein [Nocardia cyriacigeorgica]TLF77767.1 hypothetical protein FEK34_15885 [Nocardia cyriacigeorgica]CCF63624.1 protein of unknown function [Nocardia cyriacigeorgica GUH-2]
MPTAAPTVPTIDRSEFDQLSHRGAAGGVAALADDDAVARWRSEYPEWRGRYWAFLDDGYDVLRLHPINVARARTTDRA